MSHLSKLIPLLLLTPIIICFFSYPNPEESISIIDRKVFSQSSIGHSLNLLQFEFMKNLIHVFTLVQALFFLWKCLMYTCTQYFFILA